jgi:spore coat polysaccharide biosynthesis protein SpsF
VADRVVIVVQARMGSSRLPGKSLMALGDEPLLSHVLRRADLVGRDLALASVVLATSVSLKDDPLETLVRASFPDVHVSRGSERDVLSRVRDAVRMWQGDTVVRLTGDCPLLDPAVVWEVLDLYKRERSGVSRYCCYASNDTTRSGYPDGTDVEVFSRDALELAAWSVRDVGEAEHVTTWIRRHCPTAMLASVAGDCSHLKLSVDTAEDLEFVRRVYDRLPRGVTAWQQTVRAAEEVRRA